jgi:hypothetical protein
MPAVDSPDIASCFEQFCFGHFSITPAFLKAEEASPAAFTHARADIPVP